MLPVILILLILLIIAVIIAVFVSYSDTPDHSLNFLGSRPQNYVSQQSKARLTEWQLVSNSGAPNTNFDVTSGVYTVPNDYNKFSAWAKIRFDKDVPVKVKALTKLNLMKNGSVLESTHIPVSPSGYIPAGKYGVDYTGPLQKGDKLTYEIVAPSGDVDTIVKAALGNEDTVFGGLPVYD